MSFFARVVLVGVLVAVGGLAPLGAQSQEQTVFVSVLDGKDMPVTGLSVGDFTVREDGAAREVLRVSRAVEPMQIALLIDTSQAVENEILHIRTALQAFFKMTAGKHDVALIGTGERPTVLTDYTRDAARLEKAIGSVFPRTGSGTYAMDAVISAADALRRRKAVRPHIILFSARGPEFSDRYHKTVLEALQEARATFHALVLVRTGSIAMDREAQEVELALANGTKMSGGRQDDLLSVMGLADRLTALATELDGQYQITYARPSKLVPPRQLEITLTKPGPTLRARQWP